MKKLIVFDLDESKRVIEAITACLDGAEDTKLREVESR